MTRFVTSLLFILPLFCMSASADDSHEEAIRALYDSDIKLRLDSPLIVAAVNEQNQKHADFSQSKIDKLGQQWRAETAGSEQPLIEKVLSTDLSDYLKEVKEQAHGLYTEIFIMDAKGLNVVQSDVTSDYWQGDESKWLGTFNVGAGAMHIGEIEEDESTQMFQSQFSVTVVDPDTGSPIGAVTIGINVGDLLQ